MSIGEDRKRHERAKEQGRSCRRNGGKREQCPYRAGTMTSERTSWLLGFEEEEMRRRAAR